MSDLSHDPHYLSNLVDGVRQQRNQATDTVAHLAATIAMKDAEIKALQTRVDILTEANGRTSVEASDQKAGLPLPAALVAPPAAPSDGATSEALLS
jgi:SMC interacting uncharacterized protein involved in chromosome segregation